MTNKNTAQIKIPAHYLLHKGDTAGTARNCGISIPADIPDCAEFDGRAFTWAEATMCQQCY